GLVHPGGQQRFVHGGQFRPSAFTAVGAAVWGAAAGALVSAMSSANSAVTLFLLLHPGAPL
ncbi:hypothetical protein ACWD4C_28900, partial [Streptomyces sp. NPDC002545]